MNLLLFCLASSAEDLIPFENKSLGLWGYRNQKTGDIVIDTKYDEVGGFRIGQLWGFINLKGEMIIIPKFEKVGEFSDEYVWVENSKGVCLLDKNEEALISLIYDKVKYVNHGILGIKNDSKWGMVNSLGEEVLPAVYEHIDDFHNGMNRIEKMGNTDSLIRREKSSFPSI